jgi:hypothetical protein
MDHIDPDEEEGERKCEEGGGGLHDDEFYHLYSSLNNVRANKSRIIR